jgi:phosphoglycolate phosphatase-like HAD superfamily hydrolase
MAAKIPDNIGLIILDFWDTLCIQNGSAEWVLRSETEDFLKATADKKRAIASTESAVDIRDRLGALQGHFLNIYGANYTFRRDGQQYKNLGRICRELGVKPERAVMIGDQEGLDGGSAERYGLQFIHVPTYHKDRFFTLMDLLNKEKVE